jgi:heme-degrading monooxygenase HmoA
MAFVSLTRLRVRSVRFLPLFAMHAIRSNRQVQRAPGFLAGSLLPDRKWTFWTMTAWDSEAAMRAYMIGGAHKRAMPHLMHWCDEASVAHWTQPDVALPPWEEADARMRTAGRASKVNHPSPHHADLSYEAPRTSGAAPIRRA